MRCVTFGEIIMRLNPKGYYRLIQANELEVSYAGGEANVAVSLARFGVDASFVTKLPQGDLGECVISELRRFGVDTRSIVRGGDRLGIYFIERGASQRASKVIYDRAGSSIVMAKPEDFDWDAIFEGADWFHFTGITPALGPDSPEACLAAVKAAKARGITVSCDLNYRKKLWSKERAREVMSELMPYVDVVIANEADADDVFGIRAEGADVENGKISRDGYIGVAKRICERFGSKKVAITLRESISASRNNWSGMLYDAQSAQACFSPEYEIQIVDRVGGGDSFGGGLIYALMNGYADQDAVNFAVAASCLKHSIEHDFNLVTLEEVKALAAGNASGRIQR